KTLSLVDSAIFGVVAPFGCLVAGWICDRVDHKASYCLFGLAQLLLAVVLTRSRRPMQTPVESRIASA
ncbi:MAG TPA: hypothetical protein VH328_15095, partial [Burkholderiaceae bacterium]|nr:hypothetical protein [Burkholderiaceae bacterium]